MDTEIIFDEFENYVTVRQGEPYRWMPFGNIFKGGKLRNVTPDFAKGLKLPPWKPPIKIGGHKDDQPAGGHIAGFEIREDGIYIIPELLPKGEQAFADGSFRYHSPEIAWEGSLEDHKTGELIEGPFIMGDALLHTPHLGEDAALFVKNLEEELPMEETYQFPKNFWDEHVAPLFKRATDPPDPPADPEIPEEYTAAVAERDNLKAELDTLKAARQREELMATVQGEFATDEFGAAFQELPKAEGLVDILAGLEDEQRAVIVQQFRALSKQIDESALLGERGTEGGGEDNPVTAYNAAITAKMAELKVDYNAAKAALDQEHPELVRAYVAATTKRGE